MVIIYCYLKKVNYNKLFSYMTKISKKKTKNKKTKEISQERKELSR